jgi:hypothetical protein
MGFVLGQDRPQVPLAEDQPPEVLRFAGLTIERFELATTNLRDLEIE